MEKRLVIFTDCGDTLVDESTQVFDENGIVISAKMIPGAKETLEELYRRGHRIALVADGNTASFRNIFKEHELEYVVEKWIISQEVGVEKPHRKMFDTALEEMGLTTEDCSRIVMIGNNIKRDILGANQMGIHSILLTFSPRYCMEPESAEEMPKNMVAMPEELPILIEQLEQQFSMLS